MTSPSATTPGSRASSRTSSGRRLAFGVSMSGEVAGMQLDTADNTRSGRPWLARTIQRMPGAPSTLATSCGSCSTVVVPHGSAASAKRRGVTRLLSMCMWASISPGSTTAPPASTRSRAGSASGAGASPASTSTKRPSRTANQPR